MQTKEDIEKWESYKGFIENIVSNEGRCWGLFCYNCPLYGRNNGHNKHCDDLNLAEGTYKDTTVHASVCVKYLFGDITFVDGKLVEVEDAD